MLMTDLRWKWLSLQKFNKMNPPSRFWNCHHQNNFHRQNIVTNIIVALHTVCCILINYRNIFKFDFLEFKYSNKMFSILFIFFSTVKSSKKILNFSMISLFRLNVSQTIEVSRWILSGHLDCDVDKNEQLLPAGVFVIFFDIRRVQTSFR